MGGVILNNKYLIINFNSRIFIPLAQGFASLGCNVKELILDYNQNITENMLKIKNEIAKTKPAIIFSFGWWDMNIDIKEYKKIIKSTDCIHAFWTIDDPNCMELISLPMAEISSCIFTSDGDSIENYTKKGINSSFLPCACDKTIHTKTKSSNKYKHDLVLLANNYNTKNNIPFPKRKKGIKQVLKPLLTGEFNIKVYGRWWRDKNRLFTLPSKYYGGIISPIKVGKVYSSAKIALGITSIDNSRTMLSMRVFEALGSGALYISQYSQSLNNFFNHKEHLILTKTPEETIKYVNYYLKNKREREKIAQNGQNYIYKNHTYTHRAKKVIKTLKKIQN
jgi:spore maturation protein CgeB